MGVLETFSKRKKRLEMAGKKDVYQYDLLPAKFRGQVIHIWNTSIGSYVDASYSYTSRYDESPSNEMWVNIHNLLAREEGVSHLGDGFSDPAAQCRQYLLSAETDDALSIIQLSFQYIDVVVRKVDVYIAQKARINQSADDAIQELNDRFKEHAIGYEYMGGILVRLDSQFLHAEAAKPALSLLSQPGFDGPLDEFMGAFEHHRHGRNKEAIAEALKSFESTLKAICKARRWSHQPNATVKPLLDVVFEKGLIPLDLQSHFAGLRSAMESGLPTLSNRTSRHGQGADPTAVPPHFAAYALHLVASDIVFLIQAHKSLK